MDQIRRCEQLVGCTGQTGFALGNALLSLRVVFRKPDFSPDPLIFKGSAVPIGQRNRLSVSRRIRRNHQVIDIFFVLPLPVSVIAFRRLRLDNPEFTLIIRRVVQPGRAYVYPFLVFRKLHAFRTAVQRPCLVSLACSFCGSLIGQIFSGSPAPHKDRKLRAAQGIAGLAVGLFHLNLYLEGFIVQLGICHVSTGHQTLQLRIIAWRLFRHLIGNESASFVIFDKRLLASIRHDASIKAVTPAPASVSSCIIDLRSRGLSRKCPHQAYNQTVCPGT